MNQKIISVVTPCYNEEENVVELYRRIKAIFANLPYDYEQIYIDNHSTDSTVAKIKELCAQDKNVKLIENARNFGHIRSPMHGVLEATGDAVVLMASDLEDPPELITDFLNQWEKGFLVVMAVKKTTRESLVLSLVRKTYYELISRISHVKLTKNFTGFGLYDKRVIREIKKIDDPYPYFRGLLAELGFSSTQVLFDKPARKRGLSKNNFYTLYDMAMLGITTHSRVPLRMATFTGFVFSIVSLLIAFGYLVAKLMFWDKFTFGLAPILIGFFLISSIQIFFLGLLGEYIGSILTQVQKRPLVVEEERVNFEPVARSAGREREETRGAQRFPRP